MLFETTEPGSLCASAVLVTKQSEPLINPRFLNYCRANGLTQEEARKEIYKFPLWNTAMLSAWKAEVGIKNRWHGLNDAELQAYDAWLTAKVSHAV